MNTLFGHKIQPRKTGWRNLRQMLLPIIRSGILNVIYQH